MECEATKSFKKIEKKTHIISLTLNAHYKFIIINNSVSVIVQSRGFNNQ